MAFDDDVIVFDLRGTQMSREHWRASYRTMPLLVLLVLLGCGSPTGKAPPRVTLVAEPDPVPAGPGRGSTTFSWSIPDGARGEIYVSFNDGPEELFAGLAPRGSQKADWIDAGSTYEFRLYEGKAHQKVFGSVTVTRNGAKK